MFLNNSLSFDAVYGTCKKGTAVKQGVASVSNALKKATGRDNERRRADNAATDFTGLNGHYNAFRLAFEYQEQLRANSGR